MNAAVARHPVAGADLEAEGGGVEIGLGLEALAAAVAGIVSAAGCFAFPSFSSTPRHFEWATCPSFETPVLQICNRIATDRDPGFCFQGSLWKPRQGWKRWARWARWAGQS